MNQPPVLKSGDHLLGCTEVYSGEDANIDAHQKDNN
jgi:hypothetical protein